MGNGCETGTIPGVVPAQFNSIEIDHPENPTLLVSRIRKLAPPLSALSIVFDRDLEEFLPITNIQFRYNILAMAIHGDRLDIQFSGDLFSRLELREEAQYVFLTLGEFFYRIFSRDSG